MMQIEKNCIRNWSGIAPKEIEVSWGEVKARVINKCFSTVTSNYKTIDHWNLNFKSKKAHIH